MEKNKRIAAEIIDFFEGLLEEHNIDIPNREREEQLEEWRQEDDRRGELNEETPLAHIFGTDYYALEDDIFECLNEEYPEGKEEEDDT